MTKESFAFDSATLSTRDVVRHVVRREVKSFSRYGALVREGSDEEGVHQMRVSARRLRSELQAMRGIVPRDPWRDVSDDLKWMGAVLGSLRDLDVLAGLFDDHLNPGTRLHEEVTVALGRRREKRRRDVSTLLDSARYEGIVERLERLSKHPGLGRVGRARASDVFWPPLWEASCTYLAAIGDPYEHRNDEALHRVRIASKRCRYNFEIATLFVGDEARVVASSLEAVQDVLGRVQDRSVAVRFLDSLRLDGEVDLEVRRALRAEIGELRLQWVARFDDARRGIIDLFGRD